MEIIADNKLHMTELGLLPKEWSVVQMGEIGECLIGLTYSPNNVSEYGTLVLRSSNIQNNQLRYDDNVRVDMELPDRVIVRENDILICVRNGSKRLIGKCALIDETATGSAFGAFMSIYRSQFSKFLFYVFQSHIIQRQIDEVMGATINQITNRDLNGFKVPLPPIEEQQAIAKVLSDMDALIRSLDKQIEKKRWILEGAMKKLLTPKKGWESKQLRQLVIFSNGVGHEGYVAELGRYVLVNSKFISTGGLTRKHVSINLSPLEKGAITMVMSDVPNGKALARCFLIPEDGLYALNQRICSLKALDFIDNEFLFLVLNRNKYFLSFDSGTGQTNLKKEDVLSCEIHFPPSKSEQTRIALILSDMSEEISELEFKYEKLTNLKSGLMSDLLTGKTRLV